MLCWSTRDCPGDRHGRTRGRARYGTRHPGYAVSGRVRKCIEEVGIEEVFGWSKATAGFRKTRHCGLARVNWMFTLTITAYNLVRLPRLMAAVA